MKSTVFVALIAAAAASPAFASQELAQKKNCMACHAVDKKVVGPSYKEVAARFAKDKDAIPMLAERIQKGSQGVWGPVPMPPNQVTAEEAKTLATWVMGLK